MLMLKITLLYVARSVLLTAALIASVAMALSPIAPPQGSRIELALIPNGHIEGRLSNKQRALHRMELGVFIAATEYIEEIKYVESFTQREVTVYEIEQFSNGKWTLHARLTEFLEAEKLLAALKSSPSPYAYRLQKRIEIVKDVVLVPIVTRSKRLLAGADLERYLDSAEGQHKLSSKARGLCQSMSLNWTGAQNALRMDLASVKQLEEASARIQCKAAARIIAE
jgi:hypothetical protein